MVSPNFKSLRNGEAAQRAAVTVRDPVNAT
jgi:hypothetical protein